MPIHGAAAYWQLPCGCAADQQPAGNNHPRVCVVIIAAMGGAVTARSLAHERMRKV